MSTINFLPASYFKRRHRRVRILVEAAVVSVVAALLVVAHMVGESGMLDLRDYARQTKNEGTAVQRQFKELAALQAEHRELSGQLRVHRQVTLPVSFTHVLAALSELAPESIAMTDLRLETKPPVPSAPPGSPAAKAATDAKSKKTGQAKAVAVKPAEPLKIELTGLSPDDGRIADFVGALADSPLFSDVKLLFSRSSEQDGVVSRRFRVTMEVRLDRTYLDTASRQATETNEEVVHAD